MFSLMVFLLFLVLLFTFVLLLNVHYKQ